MSQNNQNPSNQTCGSAYQDKILIHERDRYRCLNCREGFDDASHLDVDHNVARGKGGSNTASNKSTLCRRCHEAKHGEREYAPTVRLVSTGEMIDKDFRWFRHLWKEQFPALTQTVLRDSVVPKIDLSDDLSYKAWHIPIGDLRRLDEVLADMDVKYAPLGAHNYM